MAEFFTMPKLGMDMTEGVLIRWLKKEGDAIKKGEPLAEIETDKASVEVESPHAGQVLKLYHAEGDTVFIGLPLAAIGQAGEVPPPLPQEQAAKAENVAPAVSQPMEATPPPLAAMPGNRTKLRISPRARKLANLHQIDPAMLSPTGCDGRIVERDVRKYIETGAPASRKSAVRIPGERVVPFQGIRKTIAARMHQSLSEMAQANHRMDVDMTALRALREVLKSDPRHKGLSFVDLMILVCSKALIDCPEANSCLQPDGLHLRNYTSIGVAVATDRGLVVPVVHNADLLTLSEITHKTGKLIEKARKGALKPDEMRGGTFTLTNLGMYGVDSFTAIVNPPEVCILATGRIADRVVAENGQVVIRPIMTLSLSYDHRVLDGAPAADFLRRIKQYVENPALLFVSNE